MKKVLITGIGGYIGSNLASLLGKSCEVTGIGRATRFAELKKILPMQVRLIDADIADENKVAHAARGMDAVVHCASLVSDHLCRKNPKEARRVIVDGSKVVATVASHEKALFIHLSTFAVYSSYRKRPMPLIEESKLLSDNVYGSLKAEAEKEINLLRINSMKTNNFSPITLRLAHVYGMGGGLKPQERKVVEVFIEAACQGKEILVHGDGQEGLDLIHVGDVTRLINELIQHAPANPLLWNVGSGKKVTVLELAKLVSEECIKVYGRAGDVRFISSPREINSFIYMPTNEKKFSRWLSIAEALKFAPWLPSISLRKGIREMLQAGLKHF